ncbi:MAG: hypothetical protein Q4D38_02110 [Planctomycetia bacterium]|nr:hypothetical protein [Planctomycetia bacterium]
MDDSDAIAGLALYPPLELGTTACKTSRKTGILNDDEYNNTSLLKFPVPSAIGATHHGSQSVA